MKLTNLPPCTNIETPKVLKKAISANRALAKLNGTAKDSLGIVSIDLC